MPKEDTHRISKLERIACAIRRDVIELAKSSKSGHIGSSLSCVELLVGLYFDFLRIDPKNPQWTNRDRFIMSKGHACVPYYSCLQRHGFIPAQTLAAYGEEGGTLGHHPKRDPRYSIEINTGSLGHGLSVGCGLALSAKRRSASWRAVVMMSDGEQGAGPIWEAASFASHHQLSNMLAIVDFNKMQALGNTHEVLDIEPLDERYRSFGWAVKRIDGHDLSEVTETLDQFPFDDSKPSVIIADTVKGKGISFMENSLLWHYRCPDDEEYPAALAELDHA